MEKTCYIAGAGDNTGTDFKINEGDCVIAADGGVKILEKLNITPDYILGDFDSLGYVPKGDNVIRYKVMKDDTDMMLAVGLAMEKGYNNIVIYGGTKGKRIDHTFANIQVMLYASKRDVNIKMIDDVNTYYMITNRKITIPKQEKGDLSVFAIGGDAKEVTIKGALYHAEKVTIEPDSTLSVSNSFIGNEVEIEVKDGSLLIITDEMRH